MNSQEESVLSTPKDLEVLMCSLVVYNCFFIPCCFFPSGLYCFPIPVRLKHRKDTLSKKTPRKVMMEPKLLPGGIVKLWGKGFFWKPCDIGEAKEEQKNRRILNYQGSQGVFLIFLLVTGH